MKLKLVVVDLELTRRQRRIVSGTIATIALGVSVAFAAAPRTFTAGEVLKASDLNANFAGLDERVAAVETRNVEVLEAVSKVPESGALAAPVVYSNAKLVLAPGKWLVSAVATVFTTDVRDAIVLSLFDQTKLEDIADSRGGVVVTPAVNDLVTLSTSKVITVGQATEVRMKADQNGASTLRFGTTAGTLTDGQMRIFAVKLQ